MTDFCKSRKARTQRRISVGVPFFLLLFLLSPLLILTPVAFVACLIARIDPFEAARLIWNVLTALRGTNVEVAKRNRSVLVHIS